MSSSTEQMHGAVSVTRIFSHGCLVWLFVSSCLLLVVVIRGQHWELEVSLAVRWLRLGEGRTFLTCGPDQMLHYRNMLELIDPLSPPELFTSHGALGLREELLPRVGWLGKALVLLHVQEIYFSWYTLNTGLWCVHIIFHISKALVPTRKIKTVSFAS